MNKAKPDVREFVAYHSVELMEHRMRSGAPCHMMSRRSVNHLQDQTVWVVESVGAAGRSKHYELRQRFVVDTIKETDDPAFLCKCSGRQGVDFVPGIPLNGKPWFKDFLKSVANFSIGVTTLTPEFIKQFERVAAGHAAPAATKRRTAFVNVLSTGSRAGAKGVAEHVLAGWYDLSHFRAETPGLRFVSLFDDTMDVWSPEDFKLLEPLSEVAMWSRPDEFERLLRAAA